MAILTTGQFTIVDQNDAKPITAVISANGPIQQVYSKDNGIDTFIPNWTSSNLTLTANVYVGGVDVTDGTSVTGKIWSTTFNGTSIATTRSYVRNTNFLSTDSSQTYYFTCTYTDPVTGIASRVDCNITLSIVKTGTNAVFVQVSGIDIIKQSNTTTKNVAVIKANLVRSSGYDTDNLQYKWYSVDSAGVATQIYNALGTIANYGIKSTAVASAPVATSSDLGAATWTTAGVTSATAWTTAGSPGYNTLVIGEAAVNNFQLFKVEVQDTTESGTIYTTYFTITDTTDPYIVQVQSSNGDRLLNGAGSSVLTARVFNGEQEISPYTNWVFDWYCRDKNGNRTGFVAAATPPTPDITRTITANTTSTLTINTAATFIAGDLVKIISADGALINVAQVSASTGTTVTLTTATGDNANCNPVTTLTASAYVNGTLYKAVSKKSFTTTNTVTVTQYDIDGKNTFTVDVTKP